VLRLCAVSPSVVSYPDDGDEGIHTTGYWFLDEGQDWQPDPALASFLKAGKPPIYIGFGSMPSWDPKKLTQEVIEGVRRAGVRSILATGWGAAGLRAGLPTLICHSAFDQPFWGRRVRSLGCGPKSQSLKRLSANRFAQGLEDLTRTESYCVCAGKIARAIAEEDGIAVAIDLIDEERNDNLCGSSKK
jgi:UDP:flavonoid glycosyltransferase YjiC (YdhE family)